MGKNVNMDKNGGMGNNVGWVKVWTWVKTWTNETNINLILIFHEPVFSRLSAIYFFCSLSCFWNELQIAGTRRRRAKGHSYPLCFRACFFDFPFLQFPEVYHIEKRTIAGRLSFLSCLRQYRNDSASELTVIYHIETKHFKQKIIFHSEENIICHIERNIIFSYRNEPHTFGGTFAAL